MVRFVFQYEAVREQRQRAEDECQRALAQLLRERMILQTQLQQMQQSITAAKQELGSSLVGRVEVERISQFARYSGQQTLRAHAFVRKLAQLEQQVQQARQKLLEATRQRKAMDLLRQRQWEEWQRLQEVREQAWLDDLATTQFLRQRAQEQQVKS